jgi:hypothetical protein
MLDQWTLLLRNAGEWRGSFDTLDSGLQLKRRQPSILKLEPAEAGVPVNLSLHFWPDNPSSAADPYRGEPVKQIRQSFYQPDRQLTFFPTGSFCRGSLQLAPFVRFYAEFCFLFGDRRHRQVLFWDGSGRFDHPVLISEVRAGSSPAEVPQLQPEMLCGHWQGHQTMVSADHSFDQPQESACSLRLTPSDLANLRCLPDGGGFVTPSPISHRSGFSVEACWLASPQRLERLLRHYSESGSWLASQQQVLQKVVS